MEDLLLRALRPFAPAAAVPGRVAAAGLPADLPAWAGTVSVVVAADAGWTDPAAVEALAAAALDVGAGHGGAAIWARPDGREVLMAAAGTLEFPSTGRAARNHARLSLGAWGTLDFALPLSADRLSLVAVRIRPDGEFDLAQASVAVPSGAQGALVASRLRTAASLAGELARGAPADDVRSGWLDLITVGRRSDPVLSPLLWFARFGAAGPIRPGADGGARRAVAELAATCFPALLDAHVMMAAEHPRLAAPLVAWTAAPRPAATRPEEAYMAAFRRRTTARRAEEPDTAMRSLPVTAGALRRLADFAVDTGFPGHWAVDRRRRLRHDAVWNAVWSPAP
jgi:hypothetical protein